MLRLWPVLVHQIRRGNACGAGAPGDDGLPNRFVLNSGPGVDALSSAATPYHLGAFSAASAAALLAFRLIYNDV